MKLKERNHITQEVRDLLLRLGVSQSISDATLKALQEAIAIEASLALTRRKKLPRGRPRLPTDELLAAARMENVDPNADPADVARRALRARRTLERRAWRDRKKTRGIDNV